MGVSLFAYIEYDDSPEYYRPEEVRPPFACETDRVIDLTTNVGIAGAKDHLFIAALGQPRDAEPLFRPRGLPPNVNSRIAREFSPPESGTGWALLPEIETSLAQLGISEENLSFGAQVVLGFLRYLVSRLGPERVRLVYEIA